MALITRRRICADAYLCMEWVCPTFYFVSSLNYSINVVKLTVCPCFGEMRVPPVVVECVCPCCGGICVALFWWNVVAPVLLECVCPCYGGIVVKVCILSLLPASSCLVGFCTPGMRRATRWRWTWASITWLTQWWVMSFGNFGNGFWKLVSASGNFENGF